MEEEERWGRKRREKEESAEEGEFREREKSADERGARISWEKRKKREEEKSKRSEEGEMRERREESAGELNRVGEKERKRRENKGGRENDSDGDSSPADDTTADDPEPGAELETYTGTNKEIEKAKERKGHPHRSAKPTTKASQNLYF